MQMNKALPQTGNKECRAFSMPDLTTEPEGNILQGHAAVFNQPTNIGGMFTEIIDSGAFDTTDFSNVVMTINHNLDMLPLARCQGINADNTLQLQIDNIGLGIQANLDIENNPDAKALYSSIQRGDINGMSFIFIVGYNSWEALDSDLPTRHITQISQVIEVSAVSFPAYKQTDIDARSTLNDAKAGFEKAKMNQKRKDIILKTLF